jgi:hypothetical protein
MTSGELLLYIEINFGEELGKDMSSEIVSVFLTEDLLLLLVFKDNNISLLVSKL